MYLCLHNYSNLIFSKYMVSIKNENENAFSLKKSGHNLPVAEL